MSQQHIFISHNYQDIAFCDALVRALRAAGADAWYDEQSGPGHLRRKIMDELSNRQTFIVVLSKAAFASTWVQDECEWAYNLSRREQGYTILPVLAQSIAPSDFNTILFLEQFKRIEAPGFQAYPQDQAILRTLHALGLALPDTTTDPNPQAPPLQTGEMAAWQPPRPPHPASTSLQQPAPPQPGESAPDLLTRGAALVRKQQYAEATPLLERATQIAPDMIAAWLQLGWAHHSLKQWTLALLAWEQALRIDPASTAAWVNKGSALFYLDRYSEALTAFEQALRLDPNNAQAWADFGGALACLNRYLEAIAACEKALALQPKLSLAWDNKGEALNALGRYDEGLKCLDRAIALEPTLGDAWKNRAVALRSLGREAEAQRAEQRAHELGE